jgi:WD40 repeat protein
MSLGGFLSSNISDDTLKLWDTTKGKLIRSLEGHTGLVYAVAFAPDDRIAASAGADNVVWLWDVVTGQAIAYLADRA